MDLDYFMKLANKQKIRDISRYEKAKVYKLINTVDNKIYIGSTCSLLSKCLYNHKKNKTKTSKLNTHLNKIGWKKVKIVLISHALVDNKDELNSITQSFIDELKPSLNE